MIYEGRLRMTERNYKDEPQGLLMQTVNYYFVAINLFDLKWCTL